MTGTQGEEWKWRHISEEEVHLVLQNPDKVEKSARGRTNAYKIIGERYIKVTYKDFSHETLIISAVDKGKGGKDEDRI